MQPGDVLDGKYEIIRVLGEGGMGVVFEAMHLRLKQRCAIKVLAPALVKDEDLVRRFEREARASATLKSPHVTRVNDVATTPDGVPYMVMELLIGHDLDAELEQRGPLPVADAVDYLLQACAAVAEAHAAGIVHRDLKPGNLFLAKEQDGAQIIKVLDFGISKMNDEESKLTTAGATMGTALYMSPEQIRSAAKVDARADVWSLGVILYELLCGAPPWTGTVHQVAAAIVTEDAPPLAQRCTLPADLAETVHHALLRDVAERIPSVADLALALAPHAREGSRGLALVGQIARRSSTRLPTSISPSSTSARQSLAHGPAGAAQISPPKGSNPLLWAGVAFGATAVVGGVLIAVIAAKSGAPPTAPASSASVAVDTPPASSSASAVASAPSASSSATASAAIPPSPSAAASASASSVALASAVVKPPSVPRPSAPASAGATASAAPSPAKSVTPPPAKPPTTAAPHFLP
ncbi:MAG: serine/threonine protein kinase [Deltaproteobacteria bacterium]|nr:serine/threonine protein kinase [Deltaproteobacteria bacterium]